MNLSITNGGAVKEELYGGNIDFDSGADVFYALLMRDGFSYNSTSHKYLKNIAATVNPTATVSATAKTITKTGGTSFLVSGFVAGNQVVIAYTDDLSASISFTARLTAVSADVLRFTTLTGGTPTVATAKTVTVTSNDEVSPCTTGAVSIVVTAAALTFAWAGGDFIAGGFTYGTVFTTNSANNPGPYKVAAVTATLLTVTLVGDAVIANETATMTLTNSYRPAAADPLVVTFTVDGDDLVLDPFDLSDFGPRTPLTDASPGMIIYDSSNANGVVIAYATFSPWTLRF